MRIVNGFIYNDEDVLVASLTADATEEDMNTLASSGDMVSEVKEFVESVNSGSFKPKKTVDKLQNLLNKFNLL